MSEFAQRILELRTKYHPEYVPPSTVEIVVMTRGFPLLVTYGNERDDN